MKTTKTGYLVTFLGFALFAVAFWLLLAPPEMNAYIRAVSVVVALIVGYSCHRIAEEMTR